MAGIILYRSKYGASEQYARMLAKETGFPMARLADVKPSALAAYSHVVLCSGVYAGRIAAAKFLRQNAAKLQGTRVALFAAGLSPADEATLGTLKSNHADIAGVPLFYGRGAWRHERLKAGDKLLCAMLHGMLAKKDPSQYEEPWMQTFMECYKKDCDFTDAAYLAPLLAWLDSK